MAMRDEVLYEKDSVYIHINVADALDRNAHIPGRVFLIKKADGTFLEWKAEEVVSLDSQADEWAVIVNCKNDKDADAEVCTIQKKRHPSAELEDSPHQKKTKQPQALVSMNAKMDARRKYNISFDILDLKSFKRNAPNHGYAYIIFILKDGTTFPAIHFHGGGSKALLKTLERFIHIKRSPNDSRLFIIQEHDPEMLSKSFDELQLFSESSNDLVTKFIKDPYTTSMAGFSKVTNFLQGVLLQQENPQARPREEVAEILSEEIPGMEISQQDEPGFEVVIKTKLPPRPEVTRGAPLTAQQWAKHMDGEGRIKNIDQLKEIIFRGGVDPAVRNDVWRFLLGYYRWDSTYKERQEERKHKVDDYFRMKLQWKTITPDQERRFSVLRERKGLIDKDVTRTDRTQKFFVGESNKNLAVLYDILMTYCLYNFDLGYVQGMSDLLSPILVIMENEVDAFWCFAGLMERMYRNFDMDQSGMKQQLSQIHKLMQVYDPELCSYLESHESGNFYFCFRWILIHFKREFHFHEIQRLWEVLWTDLPCQNFHLIISLAILDSEKSTLMENKFGFTEILKHINDISLSIPLEDTLVKAEGILLQLKQYKKLPKPIKEILGLEPGPSASSSASSAASSASAKTPTPHLDLPLVANGNSASNCSSGSGTAVTTPDDSSIEILAEGGENNYYH